jgi:hypothetical protein
MQRSVTAAALALVTLTAPPAATHAQTPVPPPLSVVTRYAIGGCANGPIRYTAGVGLVEGRIGCFGGFADLVVAPPVVGSVPLVRFDGVLTVDFNPEFDAQTLFFQQASPPSILFTANRPDGGPPIEGFTLGFGRPVSFSVAAPQPFAFSSYGLEANLYDLATVRDVRSVVFTRYFITGAPAGTGPLEPPSARLDFTPVPEPSTFALGAVGGLAVAGGAWRRRRRTPAR